MVKIDLELKKAYSTAGGACRPAITTAAVAKAISRHYQIFSKGNTSLSYGKKSLVAKALDSGRSIQIKLVQDSI